jgi:hypothetical protein
MRAIKVSDCTGCGANNSVIKCKTCAHTACEACDAGGWCNCPEIKEESNSMLDFIAAQLKHMDESTGKVAF